MSAFGKYFSEILQFMGLLDRSLEDGKIDEGEIIKFGELIANFLLKLTGKSYQITIQEIKNIPPVKLIPGVLRPPPVDDLSPIGKKPGGITVSTGA